ncbi:F-box/kelch-repeat protein At3g06240-like [Papaver somniferum]|uniref:F-box/kelch-repeat protein At3g06240-like n=1 Tax=Papaver somniferum TaxID=3469 RepID=UPI000E6FF7D0|nr:F-box/kelch-repeat protein At3g06240-like [Papaver somniferum]
MSRSSIPEDIQEEILLRLPLKSILCFKSVCKSWNALLSSRNFIKDHLNLSTKNHHRNTKIMIGVYDYDYMQDADDIFYSIDYASTLCGAVLMNYPNDNNNNAITHTNRHLIVGSSNGLILLLASDSEKLFLWNPSTREYKEIIRAPAPEESLLSYGFDYDAKTDNYKLVGIATGQSDDDGELDNFSEVYLYIAGSWSRRQNIPYVYSDVTGGVLLNGVLHWLGEAVHWSGDTATREKTIISFDINTEKFIGLPLPEETMTYPEEIFDVQVLGDSLCLTSGVRDVRVDVWVMQNYGVRESWTKQFTISQKRMTEEPRLLKFYGSIKDSEILIQVGEHLGLYDQKNDSVRILNINGITDGNFFSESYVESLVSVSSGTYMGTTEKKQSKDAIEIQDSNSKKNTEVTMEEAADKEAKRKHNELLAESSSSSKRKRASYENKELDAVNSSLGDTLFVNV